MKKIFTLSTIKSVLLMVAMCVSSQAFAFGDGAYALKGAAQPYPKAAGTVYCSFDKQNVKDIPADAWKDYVEATETGIMSTTTLYTYGKAAEGYQWTGVAYAVMNEAASSFPLPTRMALSSSLLPSIPIAMSPLMVSTTTLRPMLLPTCPSSPIPSCWPSSVV